MQFVFILLSFFIASASESSEVNWITLEEAQLKVVQNPRPVFIDVTAKWCKWCKVMDKETFSNEKVARYINENYYAVRLDFDRLEELNFLGNNYREQDLIRSWNVKDLPTMVIWDAQFESFDLVVGYQKPNQFLKALQTFQ